MQMIMNVKQEYFLTNKTEVLIELFGTTNFEAPQVSGFQSLSEVHGALFRVVVPALGANCGAASSIPTNFLQTGNKDLVDEPQVFSISVTGTSFCQACGYKGGIQRTVYYFNIIKLSLDRIVSSGIKLYGTEQAAQFGLVNLDQQIQSGYYTGATRGLDGNNKIAYYYHKKADDPDHNPWSQNQYQHLECNDYNNSKLCF